MNYQLLSNSKLFKGMSEEEIKTMLSCLGAVTKKYKKGEDIYRVGESIQLFGMVVEGGVNIESDDLWGNKSILSHIEPGFIFGETYASIPFNRQQLADYLNVDRSAMSNELSKMKNDGIIEIDKNTFTLKEQL